MTWTVKAIDVTTVAYELVGVTWIISITIRTRPGKP